MPVGRPISLTPNIATKTLSATATADQTSFTVTGGYRLNELGVYRNGVRLIQGKDFTASDGSTVTLLSGAVVDDVIEFQIFDSFNIADAISSVGNQTIDGELTATKFIGDGSALTGVGTANINTNNIAISGIATVGTSITMRESAINVTGVITATSFSGDGSGLTGISGFGTAMDSSAGTLGNLIYKTPRSYHAVGVTSTYIVAGETSGKMAFTRLAEIRLGTASTMHIGAGTTLVMNVLNLF